MNYDRFKNREPALLSALCLRPEIVRLYKPFLDEIDLNLHPVYCHDGVMDRKKVTVKQLGETLYLDSGTLTPLLKKMEAEAF